MPTNMERDKKKKFKKKLKLKYKKAKVIWNSKNLKFSQKNYKE